MKRLTIDIDTETDARLRNLARQRGQDESHVVSEAVALLASMEADVPDIEEDERRLLAFERTQIGVPLEEVKSWVRSWGTADELPPPAPRKLG
jgi:predicted transcriptional regulator